MAFTPSRGVLLEDEEQDQQPASGGFSPSRGVRVGGEEETTAPAPTPRKKGILTQFVQGAAKPFLKFGAGTAAVYDATRKLARKDVAGANESLTRERDFGMFGTARPFGVDQETGEELKGKRYFGDIVGGAVEIGSTVIGGGGAVGVGKEAAKTSLRQAFSQGFKQGVRNLGERGVQLGVKGAKIGGPSGAGTAFGQNLQEDHSDLTAREQILDTVSDTVLGGATGTVVGTVLGGVSSAAPLD